MPCACTQVSFTSVWLWRGLTGEGTESRVPQFPSLFYLLISFCQPSVFSAFDLVFMICLGWFVFWTIFVLLRFSGASFDSSNTDFDRRIFGACDYI